jgi:hypothetical protein
MVLMILLSLFQELLSLPTQVKLARNITSQGEDFLVTQKNYPDLLRLDKDFGFFFANEEEELKLSEGIYVSSLSRKSSSLVAHAIGCRGISLMVQGESIF